MILPPRFKPMLAIAPNCWQELPMPCLVSAKLDGIRCIVYNGNVFTRSLKPLPNKYVRDKLAHWSKQFPNIIFDGELLVEGNFNNQTSAFMSYQGMPDFRYYTFDYIKDEQFNVRFQERLYNAKDILCDDPIHRPLHHILCGTIEEVQYVFDQYMVAGYEGAIVRSASSPYKFGRSTKSEGYMLKIKPFVDSEAMIIRVIQQFHNANPAGVDQLGYTERSSCQDNLVPLDMAGCVEVVDERQFPGKVFRVSGFTDEMKRKLWEGGYVGRTIKYKYQRYGIKDRPRSAQFLGFRHKDDL